jgi:hypothetical protein
MTSVFYLYGRDLYYEFGRSKPRQNSGEIDAQANPRKFDLANLCKRENKATKLPQSFVRMKQCPSFELAVAKKRSEKDSKILT